MVKSSSLLDLGYMESRKFGIGPDFKVYTGAMKPVEKKELPESDQEKPIVRMRGSSTVMDLQEDIMSMNALQTMTQVDSGLSLWLNHEYDLPEDLYGKLYGNPIIEVQRNLADLWIAAETVLRNPRAEQTYNYIVLDKVRLGCSIGCQVVKWHFLNEDDPYSPIVIYDVIVVEWSVCGIPANQRCWVENAVKGLFAGALRDGNADLALQLAPAYKSLFSRDFSSVAENVTSAVLRKELQRIQPRNAPSGRLMYDFTEAKEGFFLEQGEIRKSLTRDEATHLLETRVTTREATEDEVELTKSVGGKTDWPLMDIATEWTGSKAEQQIFDWARNDDGEIVTSKAKQCFLWYDPDKTDVQSGFKMPFCYIVNGSPKIAPLGVRACANVLSGGMGGGKFDGDEAGMKARCKTMVNRINKELKPDPTWEIPWEKEEKAAKDILSTENGSELIRQDLEVEEEQVDGNEEFMIKADGSHDAFTGIHSHRHSTMNEQGSDETHEHEHSHDGDSDHSHSHEEEKSGEEQIDKATGVTPEAAGEQETPAEVPASGTAEETSAAPVTKELDAVQRANLSLYNHIGKDLLGLPELTEADYRVKCDLVGSEQQADIVRNLLSQLDDVSDALIGMAQQNDSFVDSLMAIMGVPDINDGSLSDYVDVGGSSIDPRLYNNFSPEKTKEGREISGKNEAYLQTIHDAVKAMHPDCCKGVSGDGTAHQDGSETVEQAQQQAIQMGQGSGYDSTASIASLDRLSKAFETFDVKAVVDAKVKQAIDTAMTGARTEITRLMQQIGALKNMPLGNPVNHSRTVVKDNRGQMALDNIATYDEMLSAGGSPTTQGTLKEALAQTEVVEREVWTQHGAVKSQFRHWPTGIGGSIGEGVRPPLTNAQKQLMHMNEWDAYNTGQAAYVPLIDDPVGTLA